MPVVRRDHWQREIARMDPAADYAEIYRLLGAHEFPWDLTQSLGLALYRTYAVPSIGELLSRTGEFERRTHKRYADTGLILEAVIQHGFGSPTGRAALRRMNQMHGAYAISNEDMRYVLSTFVVVPTRWIDRFGYRPLSEVERVASTNYYRELGRPMNIKAIPETYDAFATLLDEYEREHFAFSPGGRAVVVDGQAVTGSVAARPHRYPESAGAEGQPLPDRIRRCLPAPWPRQPNLASTITQA